MHTTGQAFPMAFQAGGPHAQDRGLEAVATAWAEMSRAPATAIWEKPQGKAAPLVIEKHWRIVPRGVALVIGCQTFPTWNSYPGLFASLATGNTVIVKPHPGAILPLALTVAVLRDLLAEQGLPRDVVLLAADAPEAPITQGPRPPPGGRDRRLHRLERLRRLGARERRRRRRSTPRRPASTRSSSPRPTPSPPCAPTSPSRSRSTRARCAPRRRTSSSRRAASTTDAGHKSFDEVAAGIAAAVDALLADPARAAGVAGAIANPATLDRDRRGARPRPRSSATARRSPRAAAPRRCIVAVDAADEAAYGEERFGPIAFVVAVDDAEDGIARAAALAQRKGAITAALYDTDEARILARRRRLRRGRG